MQPKSKNIDFMDILISFCFSCTCLFYFKCRINRKCIARDFHVRFPNMTLEQKLKIVIINKSNSCDLRESYLLMEKAYT